jgi:hypothetical protein
VPQDAVVSHCKTVKTIQWESLADSWTGPESQSSLPEVEALHLAYVERFDTFRDPERAARVQTAVREVTKRAGAGGPSFAGLCEVMALVLEQDSVGFRTEPAYTNARMEVYGSDPRLEPALVKLLDGIAAKDWHPLLKACRSYLEVRFFHPFAEANSAASRLAFQWSLQRGGGRVAELTPLFRQPIAPGNEEHYRAFLERAGQLSTAPS